MMSELEAGIKIPLQWIQAERVSGDWFDLIKHNSEIKDDGATVRRKYCQVTFKRKGSTIIERIQLQHDLFFFSIPEVDYHGDIGQVEAKNCAMVIEGFIPRDGALIADRISVLNE